MALDVSVEPILMPLDPGARTLRDIDTPEDLASS